MVENFTTEEKAKKNQRLMFFLSFGIAGVPILIQLLALFIVLSDAGGFPKYDDGIKSYAFWCIQLLLLCISVIGSALYDCMRGGIGSSSGNTGIKLQFGALFLVFMLISVLFSVTLFDKEISKSMMIAMGALDILGIWLSYSLEMNLALSDLDVLP